ncbi:MAG: CopD family protein, partial [Caldilineaceae bacterium]
VRLLDANGEETPNVGPSSVDSTDPTHMSLPVADLQPGIYTVVWTTLSSVDGHEWIGSFPITLLNPDGSRPSGVAATIEGERGELPAPIETAARWFSLLGAMLLAGGLVFREWVARPLLSRQQTGALAASVVRLWRLVALIGLAAIFVGGWLKLGSQLVALAAPERLLELLVNTRPGRLILLRQLLLLPGLALVLAAETPAKFAEERSARGRLAVAGAWLVALGMLTTFPFASHAAAVPGRGWAILGDFVHLLAAAVWMGGLIFLALLFWKQRGRDGEVRTSLGPVVARFSVLAAAAVFVLTATGIFSTLVQLSSFASLWTSTYGLVLLAKLALVALALGLALLNNRSVGARAGASGSAWLPRRVGMEAVVTLGLLVTVAMLVQTPPPPRPQPPVTPNLPYINIAQAGDLLVHLQITPNQPGNNRFWTHLYHSDTSPIGEVQLVRLFFNPKQAELGQGRTDLPAQGSDIFEDEGAWVSQPGEWDVTVYVRRRGMDDATASFAVTVPPPPGAVSLGSLWENPAASLSPSLLAALLLLLAGAIPFLWWRPIRAAHRDAAPLLGGVGVACIAVSLFLGVSGWAEEEPQTAAGPVFSVASPDVPPPVPSTSLSLLPTPTAADRAVSPLGTPGPTPTPAPPTPTPTPDAVFLAGAEIFQARCVQCHGPHGMGDGPVATTLPVQPAVLPFHVPLHPDEDIYVFVSEGFTNLGMPAFKETLSQEEILQVVRYLRVRFGGGTP